MLFSVMQDKRNNSCTDMQVFGHIFFTDIQYIHFQVKTIVSLV